MPEITQSEIESFEKALDRLFNDELLSQRFSTDPKTQDREFVDAFVKDVLVLDAVLVKCIEKGVINEKKLSAKILAKLRTQSNALIQINNEEKLKLVFLNEIALRYLSKLSRIGGTYGHSINLAFGRLAVLTHVNLTVKRVKPSAPPAPAPTVQEPNATPLTKAEAGLVKQLLQSLLDENVLKKRMSFISLGNKPFTEVEANKYRAYVKDFLSDLASLSQLLGRYIGKDADGNPTYNKEAIPQDLRDLIGFLCQSPLEITGIQKTKWQWLLLTLNSCQKNPFYEPFFNIESVLNLLKVMKALLPKAQAPQAETLPVQQAATDVPAIAQPPLAEMNPNVPTKSDIALKKVTHSDTITSAATHTYTLRVYKFKLPGERERIQHGVDTGGHLAIELLQDGESVEYVSFYATQNASSDPGPSQPLARRILGLMQNLPQNKYFQGVFLEKDSEIKPASEEEASQLTHDMFATQFYVNVDGDTFNRLLDKAREYKVNPPQYHSFDNNCATLVSKILTEMPIASEPGNSYEEFVKRNARIQSAVVIYTPKLVSDYSEYLARKFYEKGNRKNTSFDLKRLTDDVRKELLLAVEGYTLSMLEDPAPSSGVKLDITPALFAELSSQASDSVIATHVDLFMQSNADRIPRYTRTMVVMHLVCALLEHGIEQNVDNAQLSTLFSNIINFLDTNKQNLLTDGNIIKKGQMPIVEYTLERVHYLQNIYIAQSQLDSINGDFKRQVQVVAPETAPVAPTHQEIVLYHFPLDKTQEDVVLKAKVLQYMASKTPADNDNLYKFNALLEIAEKAFDCNRASQFDYNKPAQYLLQRHLNLRSLQYHLVDFARDHARRLKAPLPRDLESIVFAIKDTMQKQMGVINTTVYLQGNQPLFNDFFEKVTGIKTTNGNLDTKLDEQILSWGAVPSKKGELYHKLYDDKELPNGALTPPRVMQEISGILKSADQSWGGKLGELKAYFDKNTPSAFNLFAYFNGKRAAYQELQFRSMAVCVMKLFAAGELDVIGLHNAIQRLEKYAPNKESKQAVKQFAVYMKETYVEHMESLTGYTPPLAQQASEADAAIPEVALSDVHQEHQAAVESPTPKVASNTSYQDLVRKQTPHVGWRWPSFAKSSSNKKPEAEPVADLVKLDINHRKNRRN